MLNNNNRHTQYICFQSMAIYHIKLLISNAFRYYTGTLYKYFRISTLNKSIKLTISGNTQNKAQQAGKIEAKI